MAAAQFGATENIAACVSNGDNDIPFIDGTHEGDLKTSDIAVSGKRSGNGNEVVGKTLAGLQEVVTTSKMVEKTTTAVLEISVDEARVKPNSNGHCSSAGIGNMFCRFSSATLIGIFSIFTGLVIVCFLIATEWRKYLEKM